MTTLTAGRCSERRSGSILLDDLAEPLRLVRLRPVEIAEKAVVGRPIQIEPGFLVMRDGQPPHELNPLPEIGHARTAITRPSQRHWIDEAQQIRERILTD